MAKLLVLDEEEGIRNLLDTLLSRSSPMGVGRAWNSYAANTPMPSCWI